MKKIATVTVMAIMLALGLAYASAEKPAATETSKPAAGKQTLCPIMGGEVNPKLFADADGKRIYFCCNGCPDEFKKDPAKYISKMEKEGIILERAPITEPSKPVTTPDAAAQAQPKAKHGCCGNK